MTDSGNFVLDELINENNIAPGLKLLHHPTPLIYCSSLSKDLGIEVFIKREDLVDNLGCGNKLRKLAYIVAEAERQKATMLLTLGSLRSNQCKAVSAVAAQRRLKAHVIYGGDVQEKPNNANGSYLLTSLLNPKITWLERVPWCDLGREVDRIIADEISNGEHPMLIKSGASNWPGLLGSIELGFELIDQANELGLDISHVIAPAGSGGTCLGIFFAANRLLKNWKIKGYCIGESLKVVKEHVADLMEEVPENIKFQSSSTASLDFDDSAIGNGYDNPSEEEFLESQNAIRNYNLLLDPNYMVKAFIGLKHAVTSGEISRGSQVVLIHTGGQMGIFDAGIDFKNWHRNKFPSWLN